MNIFRFSDFKTTHWHTSNETTSIRCFFELTSKIKWRCFSCIFKEETRLNKRWEGGWQIGQRRFFLVNVGGLHHDRNRGETRLIWRIVYVQLICNKQHVPFVCLILLCIIFRLIEYLWFCKGSFLHSCWKTFVWLLLEFRMLFFCCRLGKKGFRFHTSETAKTTKYNPQIFIRQLLFSHQLPYIKH